MSTAGMNMIQLLKDFFFKFKNLFLIKYLEGFKDLPEGRQESGDSNCFLCEELSGVIDTQSGRGNWCLTRSRSPLERKMKKLSKKFQKI